MSKDNHSPERFKQVTNLLVPISREQEDVAFVMRGIIDSTAFYKMEWTIGSERYLKALANISIIRIWIDQYPDAKIIKASELLGQTVIEECNNRLICSQIGGNVFEDPEIEADSTMRRMLARVCSRCEDLNHCEAGRRASTRNRLCSGAD